MTGALHFKISGLIDHLHELGAALWERDGAVVFEAPEGILTDELAAELATHKQELLFYLRDLRARQFKRLREIAGSPRQDPAPLSFAQERLFFLEKLGLVGAAYNITGALRIDGPLDVAALGSAFSSIVRRHTSLRTRFVERHGQALQVIDANAEEFALRVVDLSELSDAVRDSQLRRHTRDEAEQRFELERGSLLRALLLRMGPTEHVLITTMHHIAADGWSTGILMRELGAGYAAFATGRRPDMPELPIQYADYAAWQREYLQGGVLAQQLKYWAERLSGLAPLELPTDRPRPPVQSHRGAACRFALPADLVVGARALGRAEGASLYMVLLAAFQVVLGRWSNQTDIVVGAPVAGRLHQDTEGLIGLFVNTVALRTDLGAQPSFRDVLRQVRHCTLDAYAHQDLPFEKLVAELQPARDLSRQPLIQVMFGLQSVPASGARQIGGITVQALPTEVITSKFDLTADIHETESDVLVTLEYATDLFDEKTTERLGAHFVTLLRAALADPGRLAATLPLLSPNEQRQLAKHWSGVSADVSPGNVLIAFGLRAAAAPRATAVISDERSIDYVDLEAQANQLARHLRTLGVGPESIVGLCVERSIEQLVGVLGILKAGAAYLPLDPEYPAERLAYMVNDARPTVIVTCGDFGAKLPQDVARVALDGDAALIARHPAASPDVVIAPDNLAYVIYTSGSTGAPKAAMNQHGALANRLQWMQTTYGLDATDRVLHKTPCSFDVSVWELLWALCEGATLVMARPGGHMDAAYLRDAIVRHRITTMHFVPAMLEAFLDAEGLEGCGCLRRVIMSGEALSSPLARRFREASTAELHNLYGPTEAAIDVTSYAVGTTVPIAVPIGRPIANVRTYVLDRHLQPAPVGVIGELYIGGVAPARGYLNRPAMTAERFVADPFERGRRMYRTGDLARFLADGNVDFIGRADEQVKIRGFRIELGEIEAALLRHPRVRQAAVAVHVDPLGKRLVGYLVGDASPAELREHLRRIVPEHMVPSAFVGLDSMPLTASGKVNRRALPQPDDRSQSASYVAPATPSEDRVAAIWSNVLGIDRIGVEDNFFALGGHSLVAMKMISLVRDELKVVVPLRKLFDTPTVRAIAAHVDNVLWFSNAPEGVAATETLGEGEHVGVL